MARAGTLIRFGSIMNPKKGRYIFRYKPYPHRLGGNIIETVESTTYTEARIERNRQMACICYFMYTGDIIDVSCYPLWAETQHWTKII